MRLGNGPQRAMLLYALTIFCSAFLLFLVQPIMAKQILPWFSRRMPGKSPYRLFALSNFASMLALIGYPFALEPWATTRLQSYGWSAGYVLFALLCAVCGWYSVRGPRPAAVSALIAVEPN